MTTVDFITALFYRVDVWVGAAKHPLAKFYASEVVTLALLYDLKGSDQRAFWRWLVRDYHRCFQTCRIGADCSGCSIVIVIMLQSFWQIRP